MPVGLSTIFDVDTFETVAESPVAHVLRATLNGVIVAIKSASYLREFAKEPHDIVKELALLSMISHANIIEVLGDTYDQDSQRIYFWTPFIPYSLPDLLSSVSFSPHPSPVTISDEIPRKSVLFVQLARSLTFQMISALRYLHDDCAVAHRDIKPHNILLNRDGVAKLIDFGIAWDMTFSPSTDVFWPESQNEMCTHVCTGPYRAPETIFGARDYDPYALDLWSLGTTLAELYTPLRFLPEDNVVNEQSEPDEEADEEAGIPVAPLPFVNPPITTSQRGAWIRESLFNAERGSIGLAWSIFKIRGTPNETIWPAFSALPSSSKLTFMDAKPVDLRLLLSNLPPPLSLAGCPAGGQSTTSRDLGHFPTTTPANCALDFIHRLLVYPSERRMRPRDALKHPWLSDDPIVLPPNYPCVEAETHGVFSADDGRSLADILLSFLPSGVSHITSQDT